MARYIFLAFTLILSATQFPDTVDKILGQIKDEKAQYPAQNQHSSLGADSQQQDNNSRHSYVSVANKVVLKMGRDGHFRTQLRMNNRPVYVLVDTGASSVAINESTARKIGISIRPSDFKYKSRTANGMTRYAAVTIREIAIGSIRIRNVNAAVLKDQSLSTTLLGMSFLRKLRKFEVSGKRLTLVR